MRSARPRTCAADSSPVMYRTGPRPPAAAVRAAFAATSSSSVDLPTPGSPARRITAPGTMPPPSTRSSSPTPVERDEARSPSTSPMGRAGRRGAVAAVRAPPVTSPAWSTVPHAPHSRHWPTHLGEVQPQSEQR